MDFVRDFVGRGPRWNEAIILKREQKVHEEDERTLGASAETARKRNELLSRALKLRDVVEAEANESSQDDAAAAAPALLLSGNGAVSDTTDLSFDLAREKFKQDRDTVVPEGPVTFFCQGLCRGYRRGRPFRLHDVSIALRTGEITGLVGPNGSGKTTLLRAIAGELLPDEGHYGYPLLQPETTHSRSLDWGLIRSQIAHVRQRPFRWGGRLITNLYRQASFYNLFGADNELEVDFLLERLGLAEYRDAGWGELSGGFQMRFELVKALLSRPKLLVLDEPLAPLDPDVQLRFLRDLRDVASSPRRPLSVVISSQHVHETEQVADKLLFLKDGKPEFYGPRDQFGAERVENLFELGTFVDIGELQSAFGGLITACEARNHGTLVLRAPLSTEPHDILAALVAQRIPIHYFRDLSQSTRSLFGTRRES